MSTPSVIPMTPTPQVTPDWIVAEKAEVMARLLFQCAETMRAQQGHRERLWQEADILEQTAFRTRAQVAIMDLDYRVSAGADCEATIYAREDARREWLDDPECDGAEFPATYFEEAIRKALCVREGFLEKAWRLRVKAGAVR